MHIKKEFAIAISLAVIFAFLTFQLGILVGLSKARFVSRFGDNYMRHVPGGHGIVGKVISANGTDYIITDKNNVEKIITVSSTTIITKQRQKATVTVNDFVAVIGEPDEQGKVVAKFIRIMPPPYDKKD